MRDKILEALVAMENQYDCRILYACESGSRAWGFPSPDSDYDARFIFVHDLNWHLQISKKCDIIDRMLPGDLDLGGWELKKVLGLFSGCNLALNEWLNSPVVYAENGTLKEQLAELIPNYFNAKKALHHYLSLAGKVADTQLDGRTIKIKKLFYILRPIYACLFILREKSMPPTHFPVMLQIGLAPDAVESWILDLIEKKRSAVEEEIIELPQDMLVWIQQKLAELKEQAESFPPPQMEASLEPLNAILRDNVTRYAAIESIASI